MGGLSTIIILLAAASCCRGEGKPLMIKISAHYSPPSSFTLPPPSYRAASALTLTCEVEGADRTVVFDYEWSSNCASRSCFVWDKLDANVSTQPFLHSRDSGVHTCTVFDGLGCVGSANITVNVVGAGIYLQSGNLVLPNNSLITTTEQGNIPTFLCLSGSTRTSIGQLISPLGIDITSSTLDPFTVRRRDGTLRVRSVRSLRLEESGIYTYRTPDENGNIVEVYVGLYHFNQSGPVISQMDIFDSNGGLTFSCPSYKSPPTHVIWVKDGKEIDFNDTRYQFAQTLLNRSTSSYSNVLSITASIEDVIGEYSCTAVNSLGRSNTFTKAIKGVRVRGHETPLLVGVSRNITCSTHLSVAKIEWFLDYNGTKLEDRKDGGKSLVLSFTPKNTELNGTYFTYRVTTNSGNMFNEAITVNIKEIYHKVSIEAPPRPLLAGGNYSWTCTVTSDLLHSVKWLDHNLNEVNSSGISMTSQHTGSTITTLVLNFDPLKTSNAKNYSCLSVIRQYPHLSKFENITVIVKIPSGSVYYTQSPNNRKHYTLDPLNLTCVTTFHHYQVVDTPIQINHQYFNSMGEKVGEHFQATPHLMSEYSSTLTISSLHSNDSGSHTCSSAILPVRSEFVESFGVQSAAINIEIALRVTIEIDYTSPDTYPVYSPPNYRAASGPVTIRCMAEGASGSITYQWSSTCRTCLTRRPSPSTALELQLTHHDIGTHTCSVTDGNGNTGIANSIMMLV